MPTADFSRARSLLQPRRLALLVSLLIVTATASRADPLSKVVEIDFFRDSSSRNLKGLAARSDGRIIAGPVLTDLQGPSLTELLWTIVPAGERRWLLGTGPDGRILEVTVNPQAGTFRSETFAKVDESQVFALLPLSGDRVLAGASPNGSLYLLERDRTIARINLPVDSLLDFCLLDAGTALVATGNPGRIYRIDLKTFEKSGVTAEKQTDPTALETRGIRVFGEIRDRNVRRITLHPDGHVLAGSAPKGNLYSFPKEGGAPQLLQENRDAEVTDLLVTPSGDIYASFVFSSTPGSTRINRPTPPAIAADKDAPSSTSAEPATPERFGGRSSLVWFPAGGGFPETLIARSGVSFYRLVKRGEQLIIASGEQGDLLGYDLKDRRSITFPGSGSTQLNGLIAIDGQRLLALRNNAPGLALIDFAATGPRELESRRLDLSVPASLGAFRFGRLRDVSDQDVSLSIKTNFGSDELEGWSEWMQSSPSEGGWRTEKVTRGRYLKLKLSLPAGLPPGFEIDKAQLHYLAQNRRPVLTDFRLFSPNFALLPAPQPAPQASATLAQVLAQSKDGGDEKRRNAFLGSQVVPSPGNQIAYWTLNDPDGDKLAATFSLRREGEETWTDLAIATDGPFVQFDTTRFRDGLYFTRLVVTEQAPRSEGDRLTTRFETDDLIIDRAAPKLIEANARVSGDKLIVSIRGTDEHSLLEGAEFRFNNGLTEAVEQPVDGIRDGRTETFVLELPLSKVAGATSVELVLYDALVNSVAVRLAW